MEAIMGKFKIVFISLYIFLIVGSVQNYEKTYGAPIFSFVGIIDNFVFNLIPAAIFTGIAYLIYKGYLKIFKRKSGNQGEQS
jgi:hypothetical protein